MGSPVEVGGSPRRAFLFFGTGRAARGMPTLLQKKFYFFQKRVDFTRFSVKLYA